LSKQEILHILVAIVSR